MSSTVGHEVRKSTPKVVRFGNSKSSLIVKINPEVKKPTGPSVMTTKFAPKATLGPLVIHTRNPKKSVMTIGHS